jgi:CelD/BcsL family acetyltransferase involved in cellulose biosynthesis
VEVTPYTAELEEDWDRLVADAPMATFLHSRRFYSYHGDRFEDASVVVLDARGRLAGALPAAVVPGDAERVMSHPGATYGGLIHASLYGERMLEAMARVAAHFAARGFDRFTYKAVPSIYHRRTCDDDLYALFRMGAQRYRVDLSSAVDLEHRGRLSNRRKRAIKKASKAGVSVRTGVEPIAELWSILEQNLASRHQVKPVHTVEEIRELRDRFPEAIEFVFGEEGGELVAGTVLFKTPITVHAQYIASSERGQELNALDAVFDESLRTAAEQGFRYFSFGVSTTDEGMALNSGLHEFKVGFGGGGVVHEWYELRLSSD